MCLRMEMAGTTNLLRALRLVGNRFSREGAAAIFVQLLKAVDHCHSHLIAHRNLKPENVVLATDGKTIKVCDFDAATPTTTTCTATVGTIPFVAPEIMSPEERGYWPAPVDTRATGVILLEMGGGGLPS